MPIASSVTTRLAYVAEVTPGTTPATPSFKALRATKAGDWDLGKETAKSEELRADRNVIDELMLGFDPTGTYNFELSYGSIDDILEAALFGSWTTNVLKNGIARKTFTFEETLGLGSLNQFRRYLMTMVNTFSLDITARRPITGSFGVMAKQATGAASAISGATYAAATTTRPMTASGHVGALTIPGGTAKVRRVQLQVNNNLAARPVVGSLYSDEFREGDADITGTIEAYLESGTLFDAILAHGGGALSMTLGSVTAQKYTISLPNLIWLNGSERVGGKSDDVMINLPFRAAYDGTLAASIGITRAVA